MLSTQSKKGGKVPDILYYDENCPQSRSCYVLIKMMKMNVALEIIKKSDITQAPGEKINVSTFPTFIDDHVTLSDCHSILLYLCDKYANVNQCLCPQDYLQRLNVISMLFYEGSVLSPCYKQYLGTFISTNESNIDVTTGRSKFLDTYKYLDSILNQQLYVAGNEFSIADICIISTVSAMNLLVPISMSQCPNLYKWFGHLKVADWYNYILEGVKKFPKPLTTAATLETSSVTPDVSMQSMEKLGKPGFIEMKVEVQTQLQWPEKVSLKQKFFKIFSKDRITSSDIHASLPQPEASDFVSAACSSQCSTSCSNSDSMIKKKPSFSPRLKWFKSDSQNGKKTSSPRKRCNTHLPRARGFRVEVMKSNADLELKSLPVKVETVTKVEKLYEENVNADVESVNETESDVFEEDEPQQNIPVKVEVHLKGCKSLTCLKDMNSESNYLQCMRERAHSAEC